ncbi:dermonecrotic toxin domain-containing protein [Pseudomonas sp. ICMP 561]|uniref:dermonecrotic toxin domain-containing protein n=1 Tax=Pseudomonas sp. ICMP 561 TaxID=1718918 RepID=UPI000C080CBF|nr:DUF6543 domain-containing protein [Pseudomonas sp. ICMP 561]PHN21173.1 hypothetical protein AO242_04125 [Pseudomonas sp. ICMP 561]
MNDLSVASRFTSSGSVSSSSQISLSLGRLCEASAQAAELISSLPSLRQAARTLIGAALLKAGVDYNPDILFLNERTTDGSLLRSISLTDGMIQALIEGMDASHSDVVALYTRHDTVDEAFLARNIGGEGLKAIFTYTRERLSDHYLHLLDDFWSEGIKDPDSAGQRITRQKHWASLQGTAFLSEMEISHLNGNLDEQDKARLEWILNNPVAEGLHRVSLVKPGHTPALLHSTFVINLTPQAYETPSPASRLGSVFLLSARHGVEKFSSFALLSEKLLERFSDPGSRSALLEDLLLSQADLFSEVSDIEVQYSPTSDLVSSLVKALRVKQVEDLHFLIKSSAGESVSGFLNAVNTSQTFASLDESRRLSFHSHMQRLQVLNTPRWLKHSSDNEKADYDVFDSEYRSRAQAASRLFAGLESLEDYALLKIDDYIRQHLGYRVDTRKVFILLKDQWSSPIGDLSPVYRKSLFEYALNGLPLIAAEADARVEMPWGSSHPEFTFEFVKELIADLDLRHRYRQALEACYRQPDTQRALLHQRDSGLALSTWAAKLQHHISDKSVELVWALRGDRQEQGATRKTVALEVGRMGNQLRDVIVFSEETSTNQHYVLYAPGAPGGRDMIEFRSWRHLYHEVAKWSATPSGREYLVAQSAPVFQDAIAAFMQAVSQKPTLWKEENVRSVATPEPDFQGIMSALINKKLDYQLAELPRVVGGERNSSSYKYRRQLALCEARIEFLQKRYKNSMQLISYRHFARLSGEIYISNVLKRKGVELIVNTDTVYFDLSSRTRRLQPDFGPHTDLVSLTQLLMNDFIYTLDEQAPMYSSIGQDLSELSMPVIREVLNAPLGERYIDILKEDYSDRQHPEHAKRRALFAQRSFYQMRRDVLITYLEKGFTEAQYQWAVSLLATVYPDHSGRNGTSGSGNSSLNQLYLNGRLIEGVFAFKTNGTDDADYNLIYTPDAPDGIRFRNYGIFISTLSSPGMDTYYYNRVSYKDQPTIGTFFSALVKNPQLALKSLTIGTNDEVSDLQTLHDAMIQRMIQDVDEQSLSKAETFAENLYTLVKWTGTILLLPFPPAALAWSLLNTSIGLARGYLAYLDGDRAAASPYYVWGVFGLVLGASGAKDLAQSSAGLGYKALGWALRKSHPGFA